jgi:MerR family transcriptional regulator, thiopeptide resistance regulator
MNTNRRAQSPATTPTITVKKLAVLSGVSVRTLHFYDQIGLLKPAAVAANGYRHYGAEERLRLQQIMFYRELGFELSRIKQILDDPAFDVAAALRAHRTALSKRKQRTEDLIGTIDATLAHLKKEKSMTAQQMYAGFDSAKQSAYEAELVERYGEGAAKGINESKRRTKGWTPKDYEQVKADYDRIHRALAVLIDQNASADSPSVQAIISEHHKIVCRFWTPNAESYSGLGQLYLDHPDFRKLYDGYHPKLAQVLAEAMKVYAETQLGH